MANSPADRAPDAERGDMTSMIDCVFLMIVFFVCCDFRTLEAKLPSFLPRDCGGSSRIAPEPQIEIAVLCDEPGVRRRDERHPSRIRVDGHRVHWQVGPRTVRDFAALRHELARLAADPALRVRDPDDPSRQCLARCLVLPGAGVYHDDAVRAADACRAAGFDRVAWSAGVR